MAELASLVTQLASAVTAHASLVTAHASLVTERAGVVTRLIGAVSWFSQGRSARCRGHPHGRSARVSYVFRERNVRNF